MILSSLADMVAFVIRHRENDKELIRRCVENIRGVNPHVVGAILNSVDIDRSHYRDYYYAGYYYYGGKESEKGKEPRKKFLGGRKAG
jgi:Mrp family chromosome partitioning ATPase